MDVSAFDFELPDELIALRPVSPRDAARMLVVHADGRLEHAQVKDLPRFLSAGDALVLNNTKVFRARLRGRRMGREASNPKIEIMLHKRISPEAFLAFARPARKLAVGDALALGTDLKAVVREKGEGGEVLVVFAISGEALDAALQAEGEVPLPPYIAGKRKPDAQDDTDYQTVYAGASGSVAAPTAGLHFTTELFDRLSSLGVSRKELTLHVGAGTFLPVTVSDLASHRMHAEWATIDAQTAEALNHTRRQGGRIVSVGTTSLRTMESATHDGVIHAFEGETDIFITPGYRFKAVDILLTNFHLPRSTLFMLVSAFSGLETIRAAYAEAIRENYRFYSYGDACLLMPGVAARGQG